MGEVRFLGSVRFTAEAPLEPGDVADYVLRVGDALDPRQQEP